MRIFLPSHGPRNPRDHVLLNPEARIDLHPPQAPCRLDQLALAAALQRIAGSYPPGTLARLLPSQKKRIEEMDELLNEALLSADSWAINKAISIWEQVWRNLLLAR